MLDQATLERLETLKPSTLVRQMTISFRGEAEASLLSTPL